MSTSARQYCGTSLRRQRVADSTVDMGGGLILNGIDYLEVLDSGAPDPNFAQRLLDVTFLKPDGLALLTQDNFEITGGSRITRIGVIGVIPLPDGRTLRIVLDQAGDFSPYSLRLRGGPVDPEPPLNMDRQLSVVSFGFKVECPSDFDCKPPNPGAPVRRTGPPTDYLTRDWAGFRQLMLDRMSVTLPGWSERNPADLGVTLVEVLADAADKVSWFQDAVATEAYLEKARFPQSLNRHARLLGYRPGMGRNARTAVAVTADLDRAGPDPVIAPGARFITAPATRGAPLAAVLPPDPELFEDLLARGAVVFEAMEPLHELRIARNAIRLHDWGDEGCCLPVGSTGACLIGAPGDLGLGQGDLVILEERIPFGATPDDPPDPAHRQLVRLTADPVARHDPVFDLALSEIAWGGEDALRFALPLGDVGGQPGAVVRGNVILADHGRTLDFGLTGAAAGMDEIAVGPPQRRGLAPDDGLGRARRMRVQVQDLVHAVPFSPDAARQASASAALAAQGVARAAVGLDGDGETWTTVPDLLASDRYAPHVMVEPGTEPGAAYARFGDGVLGRAPSDGAVFTARLREGGGPAGNIGAGALAHIVTGDGAGIAAVDNPIAATGGQAAQARDAVLVAAPQSFRTPRRAVTVADYAARAAAHPGVARAFGRRRWTGSWYTITLAIDLVGGGAVDAAFEADLRGFLEDYRLAGHDLEIVSPIFVPLDIVLFVCVAPASYAADIQRDLLALFSDRDQGNGARGLFHPDVLEFGQNVALSPLIARAMQIDGVAWIGPRDETGAPVGRFARMDQPGTDYADAGAIPVSGGEIARLDNDPSRPEMGRVRFITQGGR